MLRILRVGGSTGSSIFGPTGEQTVQGVAATPGWVVIGGIQVDKVPSPAIFEAVMLVSQAALTGRIRLYNLIAAGAVAGSTLSTSATVDTLVQSADLSGVLSAQFYQVEAECTGGVAPSDLVSVRYSLIRKG